MNILLLSTIYPTPGPDNHGTKVCHFFAKEWTKKGHDVRVVHFQAVYPRPLYWFAKLMRNYLAAKTGAVIYTKRDNEIIKFDMDGVKVTRIPLFKPIPHGRFSTQSVKKTIEYIINLNAESHFIPDLIVGHFVNPQYEVISALKEYYPYAKNAIVYHLPDEILKAKQIYGNHYYDMLNKIDTLGFRNESLRNDFKHLEPTINKRHFICYSGIPEHYIVQSNPHNFDDDLREFIFVGEMIERKFPAQIVDALCMAYPDQEFHINYVGTGQQTYAIKKRIKDYNLKKQVSLLGRITREEIKSKYDSAQCMIMISKGEAYGLVYLEAMARGCITIASRNEGIDGVIKDGVNGFLCNAGDYNELASVIKRINSMSPKERMKISDTAIDTARYLTDANAAQLYIDDVMGGDTSN